MTPDQEIERIKRETFEKFKDAPLVWIIEDYGAGFMLHAWTPDGVAPASSYPTLRKAASRLLQLFNIGPVAQAHADYSQVVVVGQNTGKPIVECNDLDHYALGQIADALRRHGWTVKPPSKRKPKLPVNAGSDR